jgi:hypothetical protein
LEEIGTLQGERKEEGGKRKGKDRDEKTRDLCPVGAVFCFWFFLSFPFSLSSFLFPPYSPASA